jgi:hypothetical protein
MVEGKNYGQKASFNGGIYYVDRANEKLKTLSDYCRASENKFYYFCKNSCATTNMYQDTIN